MSDDGVAKPAPARILITGGGGQLGAHLTRSLSSAGHVVAYTYRSRDPVGGVNASSYRIDFSVDDDRQHLHECFRVVRPDVVVNCAAIASPRACKADVAAARAVNVPDMLVGVIQEMAATCIVVHISTDSVYSGADGPALYTEASRCTPVNAYGQMKLAAEQLLAERLPDTHICLRSSMIYGRPVVDERTTFFTAFVESVLRDGIATTFFFDEYRSPTYIADFDAVINAVITKCCADGDDAGVSVRAAGLAQVYNFGGPQRLSRLDLAQKLCAVRGYDAGLVVEASATSVDRGVATPADVGMDSRLVQDDLGIVLTSFDDGLALIYADQ